MSDNTDAPELDLAAPATNDAAGITVNGVRYNAADLTDAAKGTLASLQFVEGQLRALGNELAVSETARTAYLRALKRALDAAPEA